MSAVTVTLSVVLHLFALVSMGQSQESPQQVLDEVQQLFTKADYELAHRRLDALITMLGREADGQPPSQVLIEAHELRGIARLALGNRVGANEDFTAVFRLRPGHVTVQDGPRVRAALNEARGAVVGDVRLSVDPPDAVAHIGGEVVVPNVALPLVAGAYEYTVSRPGYRPRSGVVAVQAGLVEDFVVHLERVSAVVTVLTQPAEAEVWVGGELRGISKARAASELHGTVEIEGLSLGEHVLEVRLPCYASRRGSFTLESLSDVALGPIVLEDGRSTISVTSNLADSAVFLNGRHQGRAPLTIQNVCEGRHEVDVRAPQGRYSHIVDVEAGSEHAVEAALKPTMALFVSPGEQPPVQPAILAGIVKSLPLRSGVLRASGERLNVGPAGENPLAVLLEWRSATGPNAQHHRVETSRRLAEDAGVQGIAVVSRMDSDQSHYSIELFAAGSAQPDVYTWADDLDMSRSVLQALDSRDSLFDYRLEGALLVDVLNSDHPVLVVLEAQEHPSTGARVLSVDEVEFTSARDVLSHLALTNAVEVRLELQDTSGATTTAAWPVTRRPRLLWLEDSTRHFNRLALEYQFLAVTAESPMEQSVARLNQAIAYMAVKNWEAARVLLDSLDEGDAHPWPEGTISLLRGKCLEGLHRLPEARREWQVASKAVGQLTDEGPDIAAQAKVWLALLDGM